MENQLQEMINVLIQTVVAGLFSLALAGITYCFTMLANKIKAQTELIKNEEIRKISENALLQLDSLIYKSVASIELSIGAQLKQDLADGKIDRNEVLALKDIAKNEVLAGLKPDFIDACSNVVGDVEKYISAMIEVKLQEIKDEIAK